MEKTFLKKGKKKVIFSGRCARTTCTPQVTPLYKYFYIEVRQRTNKMKYENVSTWTYVIQDFIFQGRSKTPETN